MCARVLGALVRTRTRALLCRCCTLLSCRSLTFSRGGALSEVASKSDAFCTRRLLQGDTISLRQCSAWVPRHLSLHGSVCSLPVHGCGAPRRDSTCVGDYRSPRGDPATGPVHSPFSLSVRVNIHVSDFATSLIIVGPVTTPSDHLCGDARDLFPGL